MESHEKTQKLSEDECSKVLREYLELFDCLGYRYKYFLAPNAVVDWFGTFHVKGPLQIHEFFLEKFGPKCQHGEFSKATPSSPIEKSVYHMRTKHLPTHEVNLIHARNIVKGISSLKSRAESDDEDDNDNDTEMAVVSTAANDNPESMPPAPTYLESERICDSDESDDDCNVALRSKRLKFSTPPSTPFKYLRRLPRKRQLPQSSDEDSSDDNDLEMTKIQKKKPVAKPIRANEFSPLHYLETTGVLRKSQPQHLGGGFKELPIRLRISYRKNLTNDAIQFALIIYERRDQKLRSIRSQRKLDFTKCSEVPNNSETADDNEDELAVLDDSDCMDTQPALIVSNEHGGDEHETLTIATVETPSRSEIATALEEAAFTIQPPIHRTPTKATPIPPGTPKRRPRSGQISMSGVVPLRSPRKFTTTSPGGTPKLKAARSLRL